MTATLVKRIDALLPQTQCTKCGYQGCLPYAEAIAADHAPINRCPPGGEAGIAALAALLGRPILPLDADCGADLSLQPHRVAVIDEQVCIGCAKCLKPCPTDAIVGANKFMHSVLPQFCTACELCIPACPVDCIRMEIDTRFQRLPDADEARRRFQFHQARLERDQCERAAMLAQIEARAAASLTVGQPG